jgi:hypothetical protein
VCYSSQLENDPFGRMRRVKSCAGNRENASRVMVLSSVHPIATNGFKNLTRTFTSCRSLNANLAAQNPYLVFDRQAKRHQRDRAAIVNNGSRSTMVDYVRDEVADRLMERFIVCCATPVTFTDILYTRTSNVPSIPS